MGGVWKLLPTLCLFTVAALVLPDVSARGEHSSVAALWMIPVPAVKTGCRGTVGECLENNEDEFELDSESNRRILQTRRYISYGALQRDSVPCSRRGASYYNCLPGAHANPYQRGCSAITRCRS